MTYTALVEACCCTGRDQHAVLSADAHIVFRAQLRRAIRQIAGRILLSRTCSLAGLNSTVVARPLVDERDTASAEGAVRVGVVKLITPVRVGSRSLWPVSVRRGTSRNALARRTVDSARSVLFNRLVLGGKRNFGLVRFFVEFKGSFGNQRTRLE